MSGSRDGRAPSARCHGHRGRRQPRQAGKFGAQADELYALRLWPAPAQLQPGRTPLWLGTAQVLRYQRHLKLFGLWRPLPATEPALDAFRQALNGMETREQTLPESGMPLLMIRSEP